MEKKFYITSLFCNYNGVSDIIIFMILLDFFSEQEHISILSKNEYLKKQALACLTTGNEGLSKHDFSLQFGDQMLSDEDLIIFKKAGFNVQKNEDTVIISWEKIKSAKKGFDVSIANLEQIPVKGSDRAKILSYIGLLNKELDLLQPGDKVDVNIKDYIKDNFDENMWYTVLETVMYYFRINGYEVTIDYNYPPKIEVSKSGRPISKYAEEIKTLSKLLK